VDAELCVVGDGTLRQSLERRARELGISRRVTFTGFVNHDDLPAFYAGADVFVLPSTVETQGMVAMEAMLFAKPVVVSESIVSARELVDHGRNGYVVKTNDVDDLAGRLETLARDPGLRLSMGRASVAKSAAYSLDGVVDAIEAVYSRLISGQFGTGRLVRTDSADAAGERASARVALTASLGILAAVMTLFATVMWMNRPPSVQACHAPGLDATAQAVPDWPLVSAVSRNCN
jgi:hypothetical protein